MSTTTTVEVVLADHEASFSHIEEVLATKTQLLQAIASGIASLVARELKRLQ